jgi:Gram-negative bacterial TonB protein C-terminal
MRFHSSFFPLLTATAILSVFTSVSNGQPSSPSQTAPAATSASAAIGGVDKTPPLTEDALRTRLVGKMVFLRGLYVGDSLTFDEDGKVNGSPGTTSFTLSALEVKKVNLSKRKLEIEADRYALHFFGTLPYEAGSKPFDKVKISKKPVHITIEREVVVVPKVKKVKDAKNAPPAANAPGTPGIAAPVEAAAGTASAPPAAATTQAAVAVELAPGTTTSPAHSAMLMNTALDNVFSTDIDERMLAHLPDFWQEYFNSKNQHREFMPTDKSVQTITAGVVPPRVLNSIDPSSNEYAQKYGIAGLALCRTVVDATGKPEQIAIARPIGFGLDEKAVDAIMKSRFTPASENGHPVSVVIDVVVTFRIFSNRTKPGSVVKGSKDPEVAASAWDADSSKPTPKALQ